VLTCVWRSESFVGKVPDIYKAPLFRIKAPARLRILVWGTPVKKN
jgi:hypothetical protein